MKSTKSGLRPAGCSHLGSNQYCFRLLTLYIGYVLKIAIRFFSFRGCRNWPSATATVTALPLTTGGGWGCPTVEIPYKYHIDGEPYTGLHEEPFLLADSLGEYVAQFT